MNQTPLSPDHQAYLKSLKHQKYRIHFWQVASMVIFFALWELLARVGVIDTFLFSSPSAIWKLFLVYLTSGELFLHVGISVWETVLGFTIGTVVGVFIAIILWWSETLAKICDPLLVILNALPKTALAPILIVWVGAGIDGIVAVAVITSVVVTILSAYNYFITVDPDKIKMLQSFGANKWQILTKLILPANVSNLINILKINLGMSWVGVIVGEFLVSRCGIGYLIVYGGQVFRLDLVMMGVFVLALCTWLMYAVINLAERLVTRSRG